MVSIAESEEISSRWLEREKKKIKSIYVHVLKKKKKLVRKIHVGNDLRMKAIRAVPPPAGAFPGYE